MVAAEKPDAGEVLLEGRTFDEADPKMRAQVATVLDDIDFFPDLSVVEHLELLALAHGAAREAVEGVVVELGLDRARDQLPATLSSGQRRRLALASCFVSVPVGYSCSTSRSKARCRRARLARVTPVGGAGGGTAVLFASHDLDIVDQIADSRLQLGA